MYATNAIYSRIIGLQASGREDLKNELAPVPMAMFDNSGDIRVAKIKLTLKRELQVETFNRHTDQDNSLIVNGSVMLWESPGLCRQGSDLDPQKCSRIWRLLGIRHILYMEYSIKDNPRNTRQKGASRQHHLTLNMQ